MATFDGVTAAFRQFVEKRAVLRLRRDVPGSPGSADDDRHIEDRRVVTYGTNPAGRCALYRCLHGWRQVDLLRHPFGTVAATGVTELKILVLPMPGLHNVSNATAAIAVASQLGVRAQKILKRAFPSSAASSGASPIPGTVNGVTDLRRLRASSGGDQGRASCGPPVNQGQGDRRDAAASLFTRLQSLFDDFSNCFNDADSVIITPVYAAGEEPIEGGSAYRIWCQA